MALPVRVDGLLVIGEVFSKPTGKREIDGLWGWSEGVLGISSLITCLEHGKIH